MGSFASGFKMGGDMYDSAELSKRQKVLDARAETTYNEGRADRKRLLGMRDQEDVDFATLRALQGGVYDGAQTDFSGTAPEAEFGPVPQGQMAPVRGLAGPAADPGAPAPAIPRRVASALEFNKASQNVALAKRDMASFGALQKDGIGLAYTDEFRSKGEVWDAMTDAEKAAQIKKFSYDQDTRGFGNWVAGTGKTQGYMNYLPDSGAALQVSAKEARALFQLAHAMKVDPVRARTEMDAVSDKVRSVAKELFGEQTKVAKETNDTMLGRGKLDNEAVRIAADRAYRGASLGLQRQRLDMDKMGGAQYFEDDKGNTYASVPTMTKGGLVMETVKVNRDGLAGLRPVGKKDAAPLTAVPEDGKRVKDARGNVFTYQEGEPVMQGGVPRSAQAKATASMGLPPEAESLMDWMPGGRHVQISADSDMVYDIKTDKQLIQKALARVVQNNAAATEMQARGGYTPRPSGGYPTSNRPQGMQDPYNPANQRGSVMYPKP